MLFYGNARPGVALMGPFGATTGGEAPGQTPASTGWITQSPAPYNALECRSVDHKRQCRPVTAGGVMGLQQALTVMATATGNSKFNPGAVDGKIGTNTRIALAYAINQISNSLSSDLKYPALILAGTALSGQVDAQIASMAPELAAAISLWTVNESPAASIINTAGGEFPVASPAWYTTTGGKVAIAAGIGVVLLLAFKK